MNPLKRIESLAHGWQVLASVLLSASLVAFGYGLTKAGLAELAASFLSFWTFFVGSRVIAKISTSQKARHFRESREIVGTLYREANQWLNDRQILALALIGVPVGLLFVGFKSLAVSLLLALGNVWLAIGVGLLLSAVVASPLLFRGVRELVFDDADPDAENSPQRGAQAGGEGAA